MNLYSISPSLPFLEILADFILEKFACGKAIDNLKIILPNGTACSTLQNILINKQNIALLPKIIPISNIIAEGIEIFNISAEKLEVISFLQEKIILTNIIHNYPKLKFNIKQALQFSQVIAKLFHELAWQNLSIADINAIEQKNPSEQWDAIYQFLKFVYHEWQEKLRDLRKQDQVSYQTTMMHAEIARLQNPASSLIVAGIVGNNPILWKFLSDVAHLPNGFIILPPINLPPNFSLNKQRLATKDCLYNLQKLLEFLGKDLSDFQSLTPLPPHHIILNRLLLDNHNEKIFNDPTPAISHIKYFELEDIFNEAEQIALICQQHKDKKIAIIIENPLIAPFYRNFLTKYLLEFQDLLGNNLSQTAISSLIISISEILCNDFDIKNLFLLLKNPLINSPLVQELELLIRNKNRFILSSDQLSLLIETSNNNQLIEWGKKLLSLLYQDIDNSFIKILKSSIKIAETLYPDIWYEASAFELSNFLAELIKIHDNLLLENRKHFPNILKILMASSKYFESNNYTKNIIIGQIEDLVLLKFDLVIFADFNQVTSSSDSLVSSLINETTLEELQITSLKTRPSTYQYFFYTLLHNKQVIITRAKRQNGKSGLLPADLLLKLQFILGNQLTLGNKVIKNDKTEKVNNNNIPVTHKLDYIHSPIFPAILSATNIELLIRNPYSFYAKTILHLKRKEMIGQSPKISEFGVFIHKILEQYSKKYDQLTRDKVQSIIDISQEILQNTILPSYTQKIWQTKLIPLAKSFVEFDEERRKSCGYIYPECQGEISLTILGQEIKIMAVADRIEVDNQNRAVIIDYKTGTVPTKKDIEMGLSPQLIIEALILEAGGFGVKACQVKQIAYVKFSSSPPYLQLVEIDLPKEKLSKHKQAMLNLLEYYIINKNFPYNIDLLTYNDYAHLARTMVK